MVFEPAVILAKEVVRQVGETALFPSPLWGEGLGVRGE